MSSRIISNIAHSVFQRLLNRARENKEDFNLMLSRYGMERFLYRLSISPYSDRFILKGASLFLVWTGQNHRVTRDVDFQGIGEPDINQLTSVFKNICVIKCPQDDGMVYHSESMKVESIMEEQEYHGVRITLIGMLKQARIPLQIDIGYGDSITPDPETMEYPILLDGPVPRMKAYSRYTLVAEKLETMVKLGLANSRMKDFYDICILSRLFDFEFSILWQSVTNTFKRRDTNLPEKDLYALTSDFYLDPQKQQQWKAFIKKLKPNESLEDFQSLIAEISKFVLPVFQGLKVGDISNRIWFPGKGWIESP